MDLLGWLKSLFSKRHKALRMYKRGMSRANKHDHLGALADYTAAIESPDLPTDVRAMALYNRALVYVAVGNEPQGVVDLDAVLAMTQAFVNVKTMARRKLARMESRAVKTNP